MSSEIKTLIIKLSEALVKVLKEKSPTETFNSLATSPMMTDPLFSTFMTLYVSCPEFKEKFLMKNTIDTSLKELDISKTDLDVKSVLGIFPQMHHITINAQQYKNSINATFSQITHLHVIQDRHFGSEGQPLDAEILLAFPNLVDFYVAEDEFVFAPKTPLPLGLRSIRLARVSGCTHDLALGNLFINLRYLKNLENVMMAPTEEGTICLMTTRNGSSIDLSWRNEGIFVLNLEEGCGCVSVHGRHEKVSLWINQKTETGQNMTHLHGDDIHCGVD